MALYAIADLHLSTLSSTNKSMEVFGHRWQDYTSRIEASWKRLVGADDTVVVGGDISWALTLDTLSYFLSNVSVKPIRGKNRKKSSSS